MNIQIEKGRELFGKDARPFSIELDTKAPNSAWKLLSRFPNKEDREGLLIQLEKDHTITVEEKLEELEISRRGYYLLKEKLIKDGKLKGKKK